MLIISCIGICILFIIQFLLYKMKNSGTLTSYLKSDFLLDVIKEFLVILLGVTLALNFTDFVENRQTKESVIKLLEITQNDITAEYASNTFLISNYNNGVMSATEVKVNVQNNSEVISSILQNDTVMTTMSPLMYYMITNNIRNLNSFYDSLNKTDDEEYIITAVSSINHHTENILLALDAAIKHLKGDYDDKDLNAVYQSYLDKYAIIENP